MPKRKKQTEKRPFSKLPSRSTITLFLIGFFLILLSVSWRIYQARVLSFTTTPVIFESVNITEKKQSFPTKITIAKAQIDLPIIESKITNGIWEINSKGASHLNLSANPGESGNIILYGHNKKRLFGNLLRVKKDDLIGLTTEDGAEYVYKVIETKKVRSSDVWVLSPTPDETLTIYTCTGFLDSQRFVVIAKPI